MHYNIYVKIKNTQRLFVDTYVYSETIFLKAENDKYKIQKSSYLCKRGKKLIFHRKTSDFNIFIQFYQLGGAYRCVKFMTLYLL